jgi:hypothetical protein
LEIENPWLLELLAPEYKRRKNSVCIGLQTGYKKEVVGLIFAGDRTGRTGFFIGYNASSSDWAMATGSVGGALRVGLLVDEFARQLRRLPAHRQIGRWWHESGFQRERHGCRSAKLSDFTVQDALSRRQLLTRFRPAPINTVRTADQVHFAYRCDSHANDFTRAR